MLIAGLSSGSIVTIKYTSNDNQWSQTDFRAHESSVNALSVKKDSLSADPNGVKRLRFVSCSCDNQVFEWVQDGDVFRRVKVGSHDEWVRDVSFAPASIGVAHARVVSGGEDSRVKVWKCAEGSEEWELETEILINEPVWRVEWNPMGSLISVCSGENNTSVYKEKSLGSGEWEKDVLMGADGIVKEK
eukprot:CAMPEP_0168317724 /NCGR_PEP_ID=MMETSP0213-20121227/61_1 /TAXON_ID=151035 /ORGANISM="Euplotes harpa, Strain FSP1.4" /LENGTH=187 /DNA_ID=CAMNT_0008318669 /DNA_START=376 /DNA_END=939 /DNA_ORIENTATION=+